MATACLGWATPAQAEAPPDPATQARAAARELEEAHRTLAHADGSHDRVLALTHVIEAYEDGLGALRENLRQLTLRQKSLQAGLASRQGEIRRMLGTLQKLSAQPAPVLLGSPTGPTDTIRAGMLISGATPELRARAEALQKTLTELDALKTSRQEASDALHRGMAEVQAARTELSQAVSNRTDLPRRFTSDPARAQMLRTTAKSLDAFAAGLDRLSGDAETAPSPDERPHGGLPLPVRDAQVLRRPGEADAAGITRPGMILSTPPRAVVTTPVAATIRYAGPLLDYGNVIILEPWSGILFVLAGLGTVYGQAGEVLPGGAPVGLMGSPAGLSGTSGAAANDGATDGSAKTGRPETIYLEVRRDNMPVDPANWFEVTKDAQ